MKEFLETYNQHKENIEYFLEESIKNIGNLSYFKFNNFKNLFNLFPSLELVYIVDIESNVQKSVNFYRNRIQKEAKGKSRTHLISKLDLKNSDIAFSKPYISSATRNSCITVSIKGEKEIYFLDFKIDVLLEKLSLLEFNKPFHRLTKGFYTLTGSSMIILSSIIIVYSLINFFTYLISNSSISIDIIFKPIIALTLGIAIFDLAKTILEQEVFFKSYLKHSKVETKILTKFLSTIIIALSIEALIVVFKIAMNNYDKMINAFYLIVAISLLLISLTIFIYFSKKA